VIDAGSLAKRVRRIVSEWQFERYVRKENQAEMDRDVCVR